MKSNDSNTENTEMVSRPRARRRSYGKMEHVLENEEGSIRVVRRYGSDGIKYFVYTDDNGVESCSEEKENPLFRLLADGYKLRRYSSTTVMEEEFKRPLGVKGGVLKP